MPPSVDLEVIKPLRLPWFYRLWNCYLEPLSCVLAIVFSSIDRAGFLSVFTPSTAFRADFGLDSNSAIASNNINNPIVSLLLYETYCLYAVFIVIEFGLMRWASTTTMLNAVPRSPYGNRKMDHVSESSQRRLLSHGELGCLQQCYCC